MRLQKYLASCGIASRRAAEKLIDEGLVCINKHLAKVGDKIDPEKDEVTLKGKLIRPKHKLVYIALNKPVSYICSCTPSQGASVLDIVRVEERVFPVGRLDKDSEGLVLLTNDGELANKLTHPKFECEKEYEVTSSEELKPEEIKAIREGVKLEDSITTKPCKISAIGDKKYAMVLREGMNRQIRRMFQAVGKKVINLKRTRISKLRLGNIKTGSWKYVQKQDI